jgi:hypothetical protein
VTGTNKFVLLEMPLAVADIVVFPADIAVATPALPIEAIAVFDEFQFTCEVMFCVPPP